MTASAKIKPCLWFDGRAEEAANFYVSLFPGSAIGSVSRWSEGGPYPAGTALMVEFTLSGQPFQALNGGPDHRPNIAVSLSIDCETESEVDHYWYALIAEGGAESRCGWLTDRFGFSWQVVPRGLGALMGDPDQARAGRATKAMMAMTKLDLAAMRAAADGEG